MRSVFSTAAALSVLTAAAFVLAAPTPASWRTAFTAVRSSAVRSAIEALSGYDTARSGEVVDLDHTS